MAHVPSAYILLKLRGFQGLIAWQLFLTNILHSLKAAFQVSVLCKKGGPTRTKKKKKKNSFTFLNLLIFKGPLT